MDFGPYTAWQQVLEETFFSPDWEGQPVVMYVDDAEAANLQRRFNLDVPLVEAVRRVVQPETSKPYEAIERHESSRRSGEDAPAVLPLLACSVIAATRMANDGVRRASNYHDQFSQLLAGRDAVLTSQNYLPIVEMWEQLASWQIQWGTYRGLCTIPAPEELPAHQARIGYALSQAVLRGADRQMLPKFFDALRRRNEASWPLSGADLLSWLRHWGQEAKFSPGFRHAVADSEMRPIVERLLGNLAKAWDGSPEAVSYGTPRAELLVRFENRRLGWLARLPRSGAVEYVLGDGVMLRRLGDTEYYAVDGLKVPDAASLRRGVRLLGEHIVLSRPGSTLLVLRQNDFLDCRTSVDRFIPGEEHMILAAPEAERGLEAVLRRAASPGSRKEPGKLSWMPDGWSLHHRVVFSDSVTLKQAIHDVQGAMLAVQPAPQYKPQLRDGLPIARKLSKHLYLTGGEPDLLLPDVSINKVLLDGKPPEPPFPPHGVPVPLWERNLAAGRHAIDVDGVKVEFATADGAPDVAEPDEIVGFPRTGGRAEAFAVTNCPADEGVRGAAVRSAGTDAVPQIVLCRRGAEKTIFVSSDGRAWIVAEPGAPTWWTRLHDAPSDSYFELELRGLGGWILQQRKGAWYVEAASPAEPTFRPGPPHRAWATAVLDAADGSRDPLWDSYVRLAEEVD